MSTQTKNREKEISTQTENRMIATGKVTEQQLTEFNNYYQTLALELDQITNYKDALKVEYYAQYLAIKSGKLTLEEALKYTDLYIHTVQARALASKKISVEESKQFNNYIQVYALESDKVKNAEEALKFTTIIQSEVLHSKLVTNANDALKFTNCDQGLALKTAKSLEEALAVNDNEDNSDYHCDLIGHFYSNNLSEDL